MNRSFRILGAAIGIAAAFVFAPGRGNAADVSRAKAPLTGTGLDADASGEVQWSLASPRSALTIRTRGLDAGTYTVRVDGVPEGEIVSTGGRSASARFKTGSGGGMLQPLDFDPRGGEIELESASGSVLRVEVSGAGADPAGTTVEERTSLAPAALAPPGSRASARFRLRKDGRTSFQVQLSGIPDGSYELFVDGIVRGTIQARLGRGSIEFDSADPPKPLLDFDPRGLTVDVVQAGGVLFSGPMVAQSPSVNVCTLSESEVFLAAAPAGAGGKARVRFRTNENCEQDFNVEIEDVAVGVYDVLVNGVVVGSITTALDPTTGEIEGEIEFDTNADDPDELPLTFDPTNASVEIWQGATVFFAGVADPNNPPPATCTPEETTVLLNPGTSQPSASGDARLRQRDDCRKSFRVQIEDVVAGSYDLVVGGVVRGSITAAFDPIAGNVVGEIEFDTNDPPKPVLGFDPAGQTIEIVQAGTLVLSSVLSGGPPGGGPTSCFETVTEQPLLNVGPDTNAKGKARLRLRNDCRRSFRVQIENLADGTYDLVVGGVLEGTIAVALGVGEIELDTNDPPKPVLDFDPTGQLVEIRQGTTIYLSRTFGE